MSVLDVPWLYKVEGCSLLLMATYYGQDGFITGVWERDNRTITVKAGRAEDTESACLLDDDEGREGGPGFRCGLPKGHDCPHVGVKPGLLIERLTIHRKVRV